MSELIWLPEALLDLTEHFEFLKLKNPEAAGRVLSQRERERLRWELEKILTAEDSLLIAGLCDRCVQRVVACNRPETWPTEVESFRIL
jgi:hypothetical protein